MIGLWACSFVLFAMVAIIGYYRGQFYAESVDSNGHRTVTVDKERINQDKASTR